MKDKTHNTIEIYDGNIDLNNIIKKSHLESFEEALYVCDLSDIVEKFYLWKKSMPRVIPFYAVKCNDQPQVLKTLAELGTGFDCASKGEISKVIGIGVPTERIIFANPTKPNSHIQYAYRKGVNTMTFDNDFELYKIQAHYPDAELVIRIRCDAKKAQCPLGEKYGCDPDKDAPRLIRLAKNMDLTVVGVSFHVGSGCMDFPVYERAIAAARKLFDYGHTLGYEFKLLDIGGGFPGDKGTSLKEVSTIVNDALEKYFPEPDVTVISEPGRFFVSSAYTLICKIHSKREIIHQDKVVKTMYFINDGVYGSFNCILFDHQVPIPQVLSSNKNEKLYKSSIWGPTCDALDQISDNVLLPKLDIGNLLIFENMGAYTIPIASPFNGFPLPRVKYYMNVNNEKIATLLPTI